MDAYVTDTHALIWYLTNSPRLGPQASMAFDAADQGAAVMYVPTMCLVEIVFLTERNRIPADLRTTFDLALQANDSFVIIDLTVDIASAVAQITRAAVPEMPDRIIAATALHLGVPLISRDHKIQASSVTTIW